MFRAIPREKEERVFERRHYEAVAKKLMENHDLLDDHEWAMVYSLCELFEGDNPGFNKKRFIKAVVG